jgi:hypothetical protein
MLIIEFFEGETKVAECPATEVFGLDKDKQASFWSIQDSRDRAIKLRLEDED